MSAYIAQLRAAADANQDRLAKEAEAGRIAEAQAARERLTPLEDRVTRLLATTPIDVQHEGLSLPSLQTMLKGRWKGSCHPGELGMALRGLGWTRRRRWTGGPTGFLALWYPPAMH